MPRRQEEIRYILTANNLRMPSQYLPHGYDGLWQTPLIRLHILSDGLIAIACFSISLLLVYFVRRRTDVPFPNLFLLFSLFIATCGLTYLTAVWTLWHPANWLSGTIEAFTALSALFTAFALLAAVPKALALPSAEDLRQVNQQLEAEIKEREQAETNLRASEERWQLAIRGSNDGIWDRNIATNELFLSPRFKQMLGYEDHELANRRESWLGRIHPDERDHVLAANRAHVAQETPFYMAEYRLLCKDGRYRWFLDRAKTLCDRSGKAIRMTGSIRDITARKQAEKALQQLNQELEARVEERTAAVIKSERRFRSLFESAPDFVYVLDCFGTIQQVNSTVIARSGYAETEMIGRSILSFCPTQTQTTSRQLIASLRIQSTHQQEMEFICKDGQVLTMDCAWTLIEDNPVDGPVDGYVLLQQRDITDQKQAEAERIQLLSTLEESERRWQSFLEKVHLMVVGLDSSGRIDYVNPYFLEKTGYDEKSVLGSAWVTSFIPKNQQQRAQTILEDTLTRESHLTYQSSLITRSGEEHTISWNSTLLQDAKGQPVRTLSIGEDITERKAIDRMKNEFIAVVSHELRTPLTSIHGALDLLHGGLVDPSSKKGQHVFSIAVNNCNRLVKLVNDILEIERLESGKIRLVKECLSTKAVVQETYRAMELTAERADVKLEASECDLWLWGDRDRIIQVLTNLVDNAIKFSAPSSQVWIVVEPVASTASADTGVVKFAVRDEGRGIPSDEIHNIFERFHQADASDSRHKGGTGLGLAICRSIVQQHGGDIWVESTLGIGSCFYFTIPLDIDS